MYCFQLPVVEVVIWIPAIEQAKYFSLWNIKFTTPLKAKYGCNSCCNATVEIFSTDERLWGPFFSWTSQKSKNTNMRRRSHSEIHSWMQNAGKHATEDMLQLDVFSWPQRMIVNILMNATPCSWLPSCCLYTGDKCFVRNLKAPMSCFSGYYPSPCVLWRFLCM